MTASALEIPLPNRAARLRAHTNPLHERLDGRIMAGRPFESRERYGLFLQVQHPFLRQVENVYRDPALNALMPGLSSRARFSLIEQDLVDLGLSPQPISGPLPNFPLAEALGWLYVAEGSNLGAAFLLKHAQKLGFGAEFGARHLAGHPEGRGLNWRRFVADFDAIELPASDEDRADEGAADAFRFVQERVTALFP